MEKGNHILAAYDASGNFRPLGEPESYATANAKLKAGVEVGESEKVALVNLRRGTVKRRPGTAKKKTAKKKTATKA